MTGAKSIHKRADRIQVLRTNNFGEWRARRDRPCRERLQSNRGVLFLAMTQAIIVLERVRAQSSRELVSEKLDDTGIILLTKVRESDRMDVLNGIAAVAFASLAKTIPNQRAGNLRQLSSIPIMAISAFMHRAFEVALLTLNFRLDTLASRRERHELYFMAFTILLHCFAPSTVTSAEQAENASEQGTIVTAMVPCPDASIAPYEYWRRPNNDGVCCLFLQLHALGFTTPFHDYLQIVNERRPADTLGDLQRIAIELGYELTPVRATIQDLVNAHQPMILQLAQSEDESGFFAIPLHVDSAKNKVTLFHGPTAQLIDWNLDRFRACWTGAALAPMQLQSQRVSLRSTLFILAAAAITSFVIIWRFSRT